MRCSGCEDEITSGDLCAKCQRLADDVRRANQEGNDEDAND